MSPSWMGGGLSHHPPRTSGMSGELVLLASMQTEAMDGFIKSLFSTSLACLGLCSEISRGELGPVCLLGVHFRHHVIIPDAPLSTFLVQAKQAICTSLF